ncbi:MAG: hypothetical protein IJB60_02310 [Bacteroidaceae bacterium]|nr:hypothetical protein [Bacteroidaceae bacterium]
MKLLSVILSILTIHCMHIALPYIGKGFCTPPRSTRSNDNKSATTLF